MKKIKDIQQIYGYHSVKAALENEIRVHKESVSLYTSPSPRDGLLSRMPSSA